MLRKGKGNKTVHREKSLFSNQKTDMTEYEKLNLKIISLSSDKLQEIINNSSNYDLLSVSYAKEELSRREFNQQHNIDTTNKRTKLNKKYPEHRHLVKKWKYASRKRSR
jgi:hypothetical protein